jgi:hypothetical protein
MLFQKSKSQLFTKNTSQALLNGYFFCDERYFTPARSITLLFIMTLFIKFSKNHLVVLAQKALFSEEILEKEG